MAIDVIEALTRFVVRGSVRAQRTEHGLEHHTPANIDAVIDHAVAHETVFHHGQFKFNFRHAAIRRDESKTFLDRAFRRDFEVNGPSLFRLMASMLTGWRRYRDDPDARVRARVRGEAAQLRLGWGAALWAMEKYLRESNRTVSDRIADLRAQVEREVGGLAPMIDRLAGPVLLWSARRDARRAPGGRRIEPRTFVDRRNWAR